MSGDYVALILWGYTGNKCVALRENRAHYNRRIFNLVNIDGVFHCFKLVSTISADKNAKKDVRNIK